MLWHVPFGFKNKWKSFHFTNAFYRMGGLVSTLMYLSLVTLTFQLLSRSLLKYKWFPGSLWKLLLVQYFLSFLTIFYSCTYLNLNSGQLSSLVAFILKILRSCFHLFQLCSPWKIHDCVVICTGIPNGENYYYLVNEQS